MEYDGLPAVIIAVRIKGARQSILISDVHKKMLRIFIPDSGFNIGKEYALSDNQAHYLRNVMRKDAGDQLRIFNGEDGEWLATLTEISKKNALVKLDQQLLQQKSGMDIRIVASPVKKEAFDLMVEKACELGASAFVPVTCAHTVIHKMNQERLQSIAIEASEQSERLDVMTVEPLIELKKYIDSKISDRNLIFCIERTGAASLAKTAQALAGKPIDILIGPEGGFSAQEIELITKTKNCHAVSLGTQVLKTETAMIAALASVQILT